VEGICSFRIVVVITTIIMVVFLIPAFLTHGIAVKIVVMALVATMAIDSTETNLVGAVDKYSLAFLAIFVAMDAIERQKEKRKFFEGVVC